MMRRYTKRYIKCRFCNWKVPQFRTTKKGERKPNYSMLVRHCLTKHDGIMEKHGLLMYEDSGD